MAPSSWRRHFSTLALVVAGALALVLYFVVDRGRVSSREASRREGQLLPAFRRADLTRLRIERPTHATLLLERDAAPDAGELDFSMREPQAGDEIDAVAVDHLLTALELGTVVRKLDAAPAQFGEIVARVQIAMGALQYAFELGGMAATPTDARYLRITEAKGAPAEVLGTYVVPASFVADVLVSAHEYRSKQIVPYLSIALSGLEVNRPAQPPLRLTRMDAISFRIEGRGVRASRKRMDEIWGALAATRVEAFAENAEDEARLLATLHEPTVRVLMQPEAGATAELAYGGACPGHPDLVVVQRRAPTPRLGCVPKDALDGFAIQAEQLLDRGLFALFVDELAELGAKRGALALELAREGGGFRRRSPEPKLLEASEQPSLDTALAFLFAEHGGAIAPAQTQFVREAELRLVGGRGAPGGGELIEEVELGRCAVPPLTGVPCAHRRADDANVLLPAAAYPRFLPTLDWTRSVDLGLPSERAQRIELDCGQPQQLLQSDAGYKYAPPSKLPLDQARALELADFLRRLRAAGFVAADGDSRTSFTGPHCRVTLARADTVVTLELGADSAGLRLGRISGRPQLVLFEPELQTLLARIYLQRTFWNEAEGIEQLTVLRAGVRTVVERGDAGDPRIDLISGFRADEVSSLGAAAAADGFAAPWLSVRAQAGSVSHGMRVGAPSEAGVVRVRYDGVDATFTATAAALGPLLGPSPATTDGGP